MRRQQTADETGREEERQLAPPEPSWSPAAELLTMQQTLGNAAVSRMVARAPVTAPPGPTSTSSEYDKARAARDAFVLAGKKGQWSNDGGPDKDDETAFLDAFKSIVVSTWQGKHPCHCSKRYWEDLGADTVIDIQIAEGDQGAADHMKMNAFKVPPTMSIAKADVTRTTKAKGAFGNTLTLNSSTVGPKNFNLLVWDIGFDPGTTNLTAAAKATLTKLGGEMPDAPAGATIPANDVTAKVPGADDAARQARFTAV